MIEPADAIHDALREDTLHESAEPEPHAMLIRNPVSGTAIGLETLRAAIDPELHVEIHDTTPSDPGIALSGIATARAIDIVIAVGGDGTVRACVEGVAVSLTSLAVVPAGIGNLLASNLGLPTAVADALASVTGQHRRRIDVGTVNGEVFTVMAGTGFDAAMIGGTTTIAKRRFGTLAYVATAVRHLRDAMVPTSVTIDGELFFTGRTTMVLVGNFGTITGGFELFPDASPDDGRLDVAVMHLPRWRDWLRVGYALVRRNPQPPDLVERTTASTIEIASGRQRPYEIDGEIRPPSSDLTITIKPLALQICLPDPAHNHKVSGRRRIMRRTTRTQPGAGSEN